MVMLHLWSITEKRISHVLIHNQQKHHYPFWCYFSHFYGKLVWTNRCTFAVSRSNIIMKFRSSEKLAPTLGVQCIRKKSITEKNTSYQPVRHTLVSSQWSIAVSQCRSCRYKRRWCSLWRSPAINHFDKETYEILIKTKDGARAERLLQPVQLHPAPLSLSHELSAVMLEVKVICKWMYVWLFRVGSQVPG